MSLSYISGPNRVVALHRDRAASLRDLQHRMATMILAPSEDGQDESVLAELFVLPRGASARERLQVYAGGYPARLHEALLDAFPAVAHLVGHGAFHALTERYIEERPPLYYNINDAGAGLPHFLHTDALGNQLPFLPDLAELEWALLEAFNAQARPPLDATAPAALKIEDWDGVVLVLQPGTRVLVSPWPLRELWEARETAIESIDIDLQGRPDNVLVYRRGFEVRCESIGGGEASALRSILRGCRLGEVTLTLAAQGYGDAAVSSWFGRWMQLGLIAAITC